MVLVGAVSFTAAAAIFFCAGWFGHPDGGQETVTLSPVQEERLALIDRLLEDKLSSFGIEDDLGAAREQWRDLWALSSYLESVNYVAGVKAALEIIGHPAGPPRKPVRLLTDEQRAELTALLDRFGVVAGA